MYTHMNLLHLQNLHFKFTVTLQYSSKIIDSYCTFDKNDFSWHDSD